MTLTKIAIVLWYVTPCSLFGSADIAEKSATFVFSVYETVLKLQAVASSVTLVKRYQITRCHTLVHRPLIERITTIPSYRQCKLILTLNYFS
jgi:hypothetical protein